MTGKLIGVGVGPGDPELMTLRAHRLISGASVVAYPSSRGSNSVAREIAKDSFRADVREIGIPLPMLTERAPAQNAYDRAADAIAAELGGGLDVVVLCEGDPMFYGSFMYLHKRLADRFTCEVVPGVSALSACAAAAFHPLVARAETLTVIPATLPRDALGEKIAGAQSVVIPKIGRHMGKVKSVLGSLGLTSGAIYVEKASQPGQVVLPLENAPDDSPYFSMVLVNGTKDGWL